MKNKLKQYDIVCFEYGNRLEIGYIDDWDGFGLVVVYDKECFSSNAFFIDRVKNITKIGVMPKEWR